MFTSQDGSSCRRSWHRDGLVHSPCHIGRSVLFVKLLRSSIVEFLLFRPSWHCGTAVPLPRSGTGHIGLGTKTLCRHTSNNATNPLCCRPTAGSRRGRPNLGLPLHTEPEQQRGSRPWPLAPQQLASLAHPPRRRRSITSTTAGPSLDIARTCVRCALVR